MIWIFIIFLLIQVIGYPLVGYKLIRSLFKKDKTNARKNSIWLIGLIIFSGLVFEILPGSKLFWWPMKAIESKIYTRNLVGISFVMPEPIYELNSERHFNGDGSSFSIYKLDEKIIKELINLDSTFFTEYPKKGMRDNWELSKWKRTPLNKEYTDVFHFASYAENKSEYNLEKLLDEKGNYYAFKYYKHSFSNESDHILNVDFYLISPKRKILISINVNT